MCGTEYGFLSHTILYRRDLLTAYDGNPISYDAIGNPTTWYDGAAMTWTNGRRLATISATNDHAALGFTYDSDGLRLTKTVGTEVHKYTWQGSKLIAEQYGDTALEFFYDESGAPYAFSYKADANAAEQIFYYVTDLQGDVMQILDAGGNTVASYTYNAWGKILNLNNSTSANIGDLNPIRYRGYYYDTETGLYYLKSRYYDPEICRFINADGLASTGQGFLGANMFTYCLNNPVNYSDYCGTRPSWERRYAGGLVEFSDTATGNSWFLSFDVPLYDQGSYSLCWAFCQAMVESFNDNTVLSDAEATNAAISIAKNKYGEDNWNRGGWPMNMGEKVYVGEVASIYWTLAEHGPVYAYYAGEGVAHLVVVTGVNAITGRVYTNNPWKVRGDQTFNAFLSGVATKVHQNTPKMTFQYLLTVNWGG